MRRAATSPGSKQLHPCCSTGVTPKRECVSVCPRGPKSLHLEGCAGPSLGPRLGTTAPWGSSLTRAAELSVALPRHGSACFRSSPEARPTLSRPGPARPRPASRREASPRPLRLRARPHAAPARRRGGGVAGPSRPRQPMSVPRAFRSASRPIRAGRCHLRLRSALFAAAGAWGPRPLGRRFPF